MAATLVALLVVSAPVFSASGDGAAAAPVELPENLTRQEVRDLIARMSDDQVRELIIAQLDKVAEESAPVGMDAAATYIDQMTNGVAVAGQMLLRAFESNQHFNALPGLIWQQLTDSGKVSGWFLLFQLVGLLVVGWLAERVMKQLIGKIDTSLAGVQSIAQRVGRVVFRALLGLAEIAAFVVAAKLFLAISASQISSDQSFWRHILLFIVTLKVLLLLVRLIVSPGRPGFRLVPVEDAVAQGIWRWVLVMAMLLTIPLPRIGSGLWRRKRNSTADQDNIQYKFYSSADGPGVPPAPLRSAIDCRRSCRTRQYSGSNFTRLVGHRYFLRIAGLVAGHRQARGNRRVVDGTGPGQFDSIRFYSIYRYGVAKAGRKLF